MRPLIALSFLLVGVAAVNAVEPSVNVKLIAKKDTYAWPVAQKPAEFEAALKETQTAIKDMKQAVVPKAFLVDFVLQITNPGKEAVEIYVGGDSNTLALELTGPGVVTLSPPIATTLELRLPKAVTIEPGKSYEIPVGKLSDGFRNVSRLIFFTAPGEYSLKAAYQLVTPAGDRAAVLKTEAVKFTVEAPR